MQKAILTQEQITLRGIKYRQNLYSRVKLFMQKYHNEMANIDQKLKDKVILMSGCELARMLDKREVTSQQLVLIFAERTSTVGIENNYVFDQMFEQALQQAKKCDKIRKQNPDKFNWRGDKENKQECFPPFFGIPASYKQNLRLKGRDSHAGFIIPHERNRAKSTHGLFAQITTRMGFIPFARTNMPMGGKAFQTHNNMFGYCKNPWNKQRSCSGSSGGQGGLIGSYCSPFGFGTDVGGSQRLPAEWNGIMTLKFASRYSKMGSSYYGKMTGGVPFKGQLGPMTRSVQDIILYTKFICDIKNYKDIPKQTLDPYMNLKPFQDQIFITKPKLRIGYITDLQTVNCSPSHRRIVKQARDMLIENGHQLIEIKMPKFQDLYMNYIKILLCDETAVMVDEVNQGQQFSRQFQLLHRSTKIPKFIKSFLIWLYKSKEPRLMRIYQNTYKLRGRQIFSTLYEMQNQLSNVVYHYFVDNDIEAIVMPAYAVPGFRLGQGKDFQYALAYTSGWNISNYPSGVVPMGVVEQHQQYYQDKYNDTISRTFKQDIKTAKGMPVGVQVVSKPFQQQTILYLMGQLQEKAQFRTKHPCVNVLKKKDI